MAGRDAGGSAAVPRGSDLSLVQAPPAAASPPQTVRELPPAGLPLVLSVQAAASVLGIAKDLCYDLVARGELPALRFGRRLVVPTRPLLALLDGDAIPEALRRSS